MKKLLLSGVMAVFAIAQTNAQNTYTQNFDGQQAAILAEGWQFPVIAGNPQNNGIYSTSPSIAAIGIEGGAAGIGTFNLVNNIPVQIQNLDCAIVSPVFVLPSTVTDINYRVGSVRVSGSANSHYSMYVVTEAEYNAATTPNALKTLLDSKMADDEAILSNETVDSSFDTTDYAGERIRLVFRVHNSPGNSIFLIDNIVIQGATLNNEGREQEKYKLYPNPVSNQLNVSVTDSSIENIIITDINGRILLNKKYTAADNAVIDTSGFSSGIYNVTVTAGKSKFFKKIIKS
jgi:hypothetical protein